MSKMSGFRWIRSDGREIVFPDLRSLLAEIMSGAIGDRDLVKASEEGPWQMAADLRHTLEGVVDVRGTLFSTPVDVLADAPAPVSADPEDMAEAESSGWNRNEAPWRRYFARMLDMGLASLALGLFLGLMFPELLSGESADLQIWALTVLVGFPFLDAIFLSRWNTSPGKWLLSTRTVTESGTRLSFAAAARRAYELVGKGLWCGIPLLGLVPLFKAQSRVARNEPQPWEITSSTHTETKSFGARLLLFLLLMAGIIMLIALGSEL